MLVTTRLNILTKEHNMFAVILQNTRISQMPLFKYASIMNKKW